MTFTKAVDMRKLTPRVCGERMRRVRRFAFPAALLSVALLYWYHQPLLTYVVQRLVVDQPRSHFDRIVVYNGEGRFDEAAAQFRDGTAAGVLLLEEEPIRPVRLGILPSSTAVSRQALTRRGIPDAAILEVPGAYRNAPEIARQLGEWLRRNPDSNVQFLCRRLESAWWRNSFDAELDATVAVRIFVHGLSDRSYDEVRWWCSRSGVRAVCLAYLSRLSALLSEERRIPREPWDPDAFLAALIAGRRS